MTLSKTWSWTISQTDQELLPQLPVVVVEEISAQDSGTWAGDDKSHPCWRPDGDCQLLSQSHPQLAALKAHQSLTLVLDNQPIWLCFSVVFFPLLLLFISLCVVVELHALITYINSQKPTQTTGVLRGFPSQQTHCPFSGSHFWDFPIFAFLFFLLCCLEGRICH